jgi:hypothetical protein
MPLFFFHDTDEIAHRATEGVRFRDPDQARAVAVRAAGEHLKDIDGQFWNGPEWRMHVTDEKGATVCVLTVRGVTSLPG